MHKAEIEVRQAVSAPHRAHLLDLYASEWWTAKRTERDVAQMLEESDLVLALIHLPSDRLVAFGRVITDYVYLAVVLDVIVARDARGAGIGATLMDALIAHPRLGNVESLELVCQPELVPFYRRWGFTDRVGTSKLLRRTSAPHLIER